MANLKIYTITTKADRKKRSRISNCTEEIKREQEIDLSTFLLPAVRLLGEMYYEKLKE